MNQKEGTESVVFVVTEVVEEAEETDALVQKGCGGRSIGLLE